MVNPGLISFLLAAYRSYDLCVLIAFDLRDCAEGGWRHSVLVVIRERVSAHLRVSIHKGPASGELLPTTLAQS